MPFGVLGLTAGEAALAGGALSAVGSIAGGALSSSGASDQAAASLSAGQLQADAATRGAQLQADSANRATDLQSRMFDVTQSNLAPFLQTGAKASNALSQLLGLSGNPTDTWNSTLAGTNTNRLSYEQLTGTLGELGQFTNLNPDISALSGTNRDLTAMAGMSPDQINAAMKAGFSTSPGYQFQLQQGMDATANKASATGGVMSGNTLKALNDYAQGTASQEWGNYANAWQGNYWQQVGNLANNYWQGVGNTANNFWKGADNVTNDYWNFINSRSNAYWNGQNQDQTERLNLFNMLNTLSSGGANAGASLGSTGANVGQTIGNNMLAVGNAQAGGVTGGANANAAGMIGAANANARGTTAIGQGLANAGSGISNQLLIQQLLGRQRTTGGGTDLNAAFLNGGNANPMTGMTDPNGNFNGG